MAQVFGEVAALYDDVRPGYPDGVRRGILDYGGPPDGIVELGAGTGKGTELLVGFGAWLTALEPDPRMAAVLRTKFPQVDVVEAPFEQWSPPERRPELVACALAWHWMDAATRNRRAFDTLAPLRRGAISAVAENQVMVVPYSAVRCSSSHPGSPTLRCFVAGPWSRERSI